MGMDKYGCFMQMYVYYYETIVNSMKTRHVSKVIDAFSKNLVKSIRHMKKEIQGSYYFSFFALSNLLTQACLNFLHDRAAHFF